VIKKIINNFRIDLEGKEGLTVGVPGSVYSALYEHKIIEHPYYRDTLKRLEASPYKSATFTSDFELDKQILSQNNIYLRLSGIDTVAAVTLNGEQLSLCDNMHRSYLFDIKNLAKFGMNQLKLYFTSPIAAIEERRLRDFAKCKDNLLEGTSTLRRPFCLSDTDFSGTVSDMGIAGEIEIFAFENKSIEGVYISQKHMDDGSVTLDLTLETLGHDDMSRAVATLVSPYGSVFYAGFAGGKATVTVPKPELWWPNNLGGANLYKLTVNLYSTTEIEDSREYTVGLRTFEVRRKKDERGEGFAMCVNGVEYYTLGTEYLPEDIIPALSDKAKAEKLVKKAKEANINTLYVKGCGHYPSEEFFKACDRYGIVVIMSFMAEDANIRLSDKMRRNIECELRDNLKRIHTHPSFALLIGNSGVEELIATDASFATDVAKEDYAELYGSLIPSVLGEVSPDTPYISSFPTAFCDFDKVADKRCGVYRGKAVEPVRFLLSDPVCSMPTLNLLKAYTSEEDRNPFSAYFDFYSGSDDKILSMLKELRRELYYPEGLSEFSYLSGLSTGLLTKRIAERQRGERGYSMGVVIGRLSDPHPTLSSSVIDYGAAIKPQYYALKRAFAPQKVNVTEEGGRVEFSLCNDTRKTAKGKLIFTVIDKNNLPLLKGEEEFSVPEMSKEKIHTVDLTELLSGRRQECYLYIMLTVNGVTVYEDTHLFCKVKEFSYQSPEMKYELTGSGRDFTLTLSAKSYAKWVELSFSDTVAEFEDNYFDITDSLPKKIRITTDRFVSVEHLRKELCVRSIYDIIK